MPGLVPGIHVCQRFRMAGGWVYIVTNRPNGILYIGVTSDIRKRAWEHRESIVEGFTKQYGLKRLVYAEWHDDIRNAIQREKTMTLVARLEGQDAGTCQSRLARSL